MKHYIEITLLPTAEIPIYFLWEKVYRQIHLALVEIQDDNGKVNIGSSFPEYDHKKYQLGNKLRMFACSIQDLENLQINNWLNHLKDYTHISSIRDVPKKTNGLAIYKRIQPKSSNARLARRKAMREGISTKEATIALSKYKEKNSNAPYIHIKSLSSQKRYRLLISCIEGDKNSMIKSFSTYGLSSTTSLPIF